jgi:hypothetical protein
MTKGEFFAMGAGRDHVADLHLPILNNHPVDEQLYQLSALSKAQFIKRGAEPLAKRFDTVG